MVRQVMLVALLAGLISAIAPVAFAGDTGPVACPKGTPGCTVTAGTPGSPGQTGSAGTGNDNGSQGGSGTTSGSGSGSGSPGADPSPTKTIVNGACTYQPDPDYEPPAEGVTDQHPGQPGAWYLETCPDAINSNGIATTTTQVTWVPNGTTLPTTPAPPAPAVLAAEAEKDLKLTAPVIESNPAPGQPQMVSVPMWSWLPSGQFAATSATASVPGESVTATAKPLSVTWNWGDGASTACAGPGTPYSSTDSPTASSPTCGHTYTQSSGSGDYTVSATIDWTVTWSGGGQAGAFAGMTTTATEAVHVEQSRALVTGG